MDWMLGEAKNKFSEVFNLALTQGPQRVSRRGQHVVILSEEQYRLLMGTQPSFKKYLMEGPSFEGIDFLRDQSPSRDYEL